MEQKKIDRINELSRKSRTPEGLTEAEKAEQKALREEYLAEGVTHRIAVAHVPFTDRFKPPFNIEEDIYRRWTELLSGEIGIDIMICGHLHELHLYTPGSENDYYGQSFPVAVVSRLDRKTGRHTGGGFTFSDEISIDFVNESGRLEVVG